MKEATSIFPTSESWNRLIEQVREGYNATSFQMSVLVANFGNLARPSRIGGKRIDTEAPSVLARFLFENYAHVRCILESEALLEPQFHTVLATQGLHGVHGTVNPQMSVYVRGNETTSIKILHEDSSASMPWSIFEVTFGVECKPKSSTEFVDTQIGQFAVIREEKKRRFVLPADRDPDYVPVSRERAKTSTGQVMVTRCGKETFKFCLCHTLNSASWHAVYGPAFAMYTYCFNNQVDFIMGDGNQHYQFCSKSHKAKVKSRGSEGDTQNCLFNQLLRGFVSKINSGVDFAQRLYYSIIDNNPIENQESQEDLDCVFCHILGWG
jgi:hypothetical protein